MPAKYTAHTDSPSSRDIIAPRLRREVAVRYRIPNAPLTMPHTAEHTVQKSRFIGWCAAIDSAADAQALIAAAREHYPDASHHCSAFIAGPPGEIQAIGLSDDGEPGGTAGRPIYDVLAGSGLGRIACVITRYFGGIKLGTGGLARAYGQSVTAVLAELPTTWHIPKQREILEIGFADEQAVRHWVSQAQGETLAADYHAGGVRLTISTPQDRALDLAALDARLAGDLRRQTPDD